MAGPSTSSGFFQEVLQRGIGKPPRERGVVPGASVSIFIWDQQALRSVHVGVAVVSAGATKDNYRTQLHGHEVGEHMLILESIRIFQSSKKFTYPYTFKTNDEVPSTLGDIHSAAFYVWDDRAMRLMVSRKHDSMSILMSSSKQRISGTSGHNGDDLIIIDDEGNLDDTASPHSDVLNDSGGVRFQQNRLLLSDFQTIRILAPISQIRDFEHPLRPLDITHRDSLQTRFQEVNGFSESAGLMSVTLQKGDCPVGLPMREMFENDSTSSSWRLKEGFTITIVDGRHRISSITNISKMEGSQYDWSRGEFQFSMITRKDGKMLTSWEILMWSSNKNRDSSLVKKDTSLIDLLSSVLSYSAVFTEQYAVPYVQACNNDIALDMELSGFLGSLGNSTYKRYVRLSKILLRYPRVRDVIFNETTFGNSADSRTTGISYLTDGNLLKASEQNMILMIRCADSFISDGSHSRFFPGPFYKACLQYISTTHTYYTKLKALTDRQNIPGSFDAFLDTKYNATKTSMLSVRQTMLNNLKAFSYNPNDVRKLSESRLKAQLTRLTKKLDETFLVHSVPPKKAGGGTKRGRSSTTKPIVIDLINDDDIPQPEPPLKRPRRGMRETFMSTPKSQGVMYNETKPSPQPTTKMLKTVDANPSNSGSGTPSKRKGSMGMNSSMSGLMGGSSKVSKQKKKQQEVTTGQFHDDYDASIVPNGFDHDHALWQMMSTQDVPLEFRLNFRKSPLLRRAAVEDLWDRDHVVDLLDNGQRVEKIDTTAYTASIFMPYEHRSNVFLTVQVIKYLRHLAWSWATKMEVYGVDDPADQSSSAVAQWMFSLNVNHHALGSAFFARKKTEVIEAGYTILQDMADPFCLPQSTLSSIGSMPSGISTMSLAQMLIRVSQMFPGTEALQDENARVDWNPIVNSGDEDLDENNRNRGVARYSSTAHFLTATLENDANNVDISVRRSYLDAWIGILLALMDIDNKGQWKCSFPRTGGRLLLSSRHLEDQAGHNDFPYRQNDCPGFFIIVTGNEQVNLWVCKSSHQYVWYQPNEKRELADILVMSEITIAPHSVFIGHGYLQHAGAGWRGFHALRYHIYLVPDGLVLPDAIHFSYEWSLRRDNEESVHSTKAFSGTGMDNTADQSTVSDGLSQQNSDDEDASLSSEDEDDDDYQEQVDDIPEL